MAAIQYEEYKVKLNNIQPTIDLVGKALNLDAAAQEIEDGEGLEDTENVKETDKAQ